MPSVARRALRRVRAATGFAANGHTKAEKEEKTRAPGFGADAIRSSRDRAPPGGGDRLPRLRRGGSEPKARQHRADEGEQGNAHDAEAGREDGQTAEGGKEEAAGECSEQGKRATSARPPPSVRAFSPDARRPPPGGRRKRSPAPAPHLAKPGVQPGAESGSGGLGVPRALLLARGMSKPVASGENACTRDDGSGGPVTARSGGTTDHAAERNAGSGQAGSVTERSDGASPCGTRTAWSGAGPRSSRRDSFAGAAGAGTASPTTPGPGNGS
ncbi:MAG: hypothetical protein M5U15_01615 [Kiritimatiellae bacterium]|nr:hypothetical protein [Kiritimatiellia bacterium]